MRGWPHIGDERSLELRVWEGRRIAEGVYQLKDASDDASDDAC